MLRRTLPIGEIETESRAARACERSAVPSEERRLWFAVLTQALKDFISGHILSQNYPPAYSREAESWLFDDSYRVGSFSWVANLFAIDPDVVRGWLLNGDYVNERLRQEYRRGPTAPLAPPGRRSASLKVGRPPASR
jgi:hypothetical protein